MRYVGDTTGRFGQRPHYETSELDEECEYIITSFIQEQHGRLILPIPTDDLTKLIERDANDLDLYADLSDEGPDVEGITYFRPGQKPTVRIANGLSEHSRSENRLRTTLTHEYGHVKFHDLYWLLSISVLKNEWRTTFFAWSRLHLSEGLCVHF